MRTIYKYELKDSVCKLHLPLGAEVVMAGGQVGAVFIWALINNEQQETRERTFLVHPTGHAVSDYEVYVGTAMLFNDSLVLHVFEKT